MKKNNGRPSILLIDDDTGVTAALQQTIEEEYDVQTAATAEEGITRAQTSHFDAVVTDLQMKGKSGLDVIEELHATVPYLPVILMTAHHTAEAAIAATKLGAYEYLLKPFKPPELLELIEKAVKTRRVASEPVQLGNTKSAPYAIIGRSRAIQNVCKEIGRVASKPVSVLIRGETGTGKELVARALHHHSKRADRPFIIVNCVAIPETLLESELFGHEQGAFTGAHVRRIGKFEQADTGTIFLDEIGDMSVATQAKLLRVLQDKMIQRVGGKESFPLDVRVIAATHRDLERAVEEKHFRRDLYYRLDDCVIRLPALRHRAEDIDELVNFFLQQHGAEFGAFGSNIDPEAMKLLQRQSWRGNVRELRHVVLKALLVASGRVIREESIRRVLDETKLAEPAPTQSGEAIAGQPLAAHVAELLDSAERGEREDIAAALAEWAEREIFGQAILLAKGDQTKAAKWLGVSRPTMREKLARYNLRPATDYAAQDQLV